MAGRFRGAWEAVCAALLSPPCATCGRVLEEPLRGAVCASCWGAIRYLAPPLCPRCGYPASPGPALRARVRRGHPAERPTPADGSCLGCRELRVVDRARSLGAYEGVLRDILHALKYSGRRSAAPRLAALLRSRCADVLDGVDAIVPVPLHPRRSWARGFNQAALVAGRLGPPVHQLLRRRRHTAPQSGLAAGERRRNMERAFALSLGARIRPTLLAGRVLVLVDDVSTTGATLDACAAVLKAGGAREVRAVTVARTLRSGGTP